MEKMSESDNWRPPQAGWTGRESNKATEIMLYLTGSPDDETHLYPRHEAISPVMGCTQYLDLAQEHRSSQIGLVRLKA
jgi:hypothetical protein